MQLAPQAWGHRLLFQQSRRAELREGRRGLWRWNSICSLGPRETSCSSGFLALFYVAGPGIMGGLFPKESTPISEIILFPESGQFLHRPPEASVSCPISERICLSILYFYSALE